MGYEIKLIIGKSSSVRGKERIEDKSKPFADGSGFEWKRDDKGFLLTTGRVEVYFQVMAELDLCKIGCNALMRLVEKTARHAKQNAEECFYFFGATESNRCAKEDLYGDKLQPVPIGEVLEALKAEEDGAEYRRFRWAIALLESMKDDPEGLEVMFWGH